MLDQFSQKVQDLYDTFYWDEWFDFSVNSKVHWQITSNLLASLREATNRILIAAVVIGCLVILFGTLILINQRKTHKLLRELRQAQDKPAPQETSVPEESTLRNSLRKPPNQIHQPTHLT